MGKAVNHIVAFILAAADLRQAILLRDSIAAAFTRLSISNLNLTW